MHRLRRVQNSGGRLGARLTPLSGRRRALQGPRPRTGAVRHDLHLSPCRSSRMPLSRVVIVVCIRELSLSSKGHFALGAPRLSAPKAQRLGRRHGGHLPEQEASRGEVVSCSLSQPASAATPVEQCLNSLHTDARRGRGSGQPAAPRRLPGGGNNGEAAMGCSCGGSCGGSCPACRPPAQRRFACELQRTQRTRSARL